MTSMRPLHAAAWCVAALIAAPTPAGPLPRFEDRDDLKHLPARWAALLDVFQVPGAAIGVVKDGRPYAVWTAGKRGPEGGAIDEDTGFYIASVTKTYVAMAIGALVDAGELALDDPVQQHLPRFTLADPEAAARITIRDLLCHRVGLSSTPIVTLDAYTGDITDDRFYTWLAEVECPDDFAYSNLHYTILGRVIEAATGEPWGDYLKRAIFDPAGMARTTASARVLYGRENSATPTVHIDGRPQPAELIKNDSVMHAAGGLGTTVRDGLRWLELNTNHGSVDGAQIVPEAYVREMLELQVKLPAPRGSIRIQEGMGLGWQLGRFDGEPMAMHGGGYEGATAGFLVLPDSGDGYVILINAGGLARGFADVAAIDILDALRGAEGRWDVSEAYVTRARELVEQGRTVRTREGGALSADVLSLSVSAYTGRYVHDRWGTVRVRRAEHGIRVSLGNLDFRLFPGVEPDSFEIAGPVLTPDGRGRFVVEDDRVRAVILFDADLGEMRFEP